MFSSSEWKPHWQQNINDSGVWQWNIYVVDKDFGVSLKAITVKQQIILCWLTICIDVLRRSYEGERCCTRGRSANLFTEAALKDQCSYKTCCLWSYMCDAHFSSAGKIFFFLFVTYWCVAYSFSEGCWKTSVIEVRGQVERKLIHKKSAKSAIVECST